MILQLPPHLADRIAAGEVVERPASVAKELVENAIDAGATAVTIELRQGGLTYLRVTDNGCGIPAQQLPTAFLRHATSKLRCAEDLDAIGTLGFRGEALAAIAAVSRIEITSRPAPAQSGASLVLEGGTPGDVSAAGCPQGTTIVVRDLFFNTPARLKFMKKDSAEGAAVAGMVQQLAISRPDVAFTLLRDGQELLQTPGDGVLQSAVYAALGREFALSLFPVCGRDGDVCCEGFVTRPLQGRGTRAMQLFFVNDRLVKSQLLTAALEEAFRHQLMKGKFPGCVLRLTLPLDRVDVNVHPAKTVVKFLGERQVFDAVCHTVRDALEEESSPRRPAQMPVPRQDFFQSMTAADYREKTTPTTKPAPASSPASAGSSQRPAAPAFASELSPSRPLRDSAPALPYCVPAIPRQEPTPAPAIATRRPVAVVFDPADEEALSPPQTAPQPPAQPQQQSLLPEEAPWQVIGEALRTYILCEAQEGCLWLIDKHAAHERLLFDKLVQQHQPVMRQTLLTPLALSFGAQTCAALLGEPTLLGEAGFSCEEFGAGTVLVREIPADLDEGEVSAVLEELAEQLSSPRTEPVARREALLKTVACKAAVKAGMFSGDAERQALVEQVQAGVVTHCPHGRPVAVKLSKYELEKMFKRA